MLKASADDVDLLTDSFAVRGVCQENRSRWAVAQFHDGFVLTWLPEGVDGQPAGRARVEPASIARSQMKKGFWPLQRPPGRAQYRLP